MLASYSYIAVPTLTILALALLLLILASCVVTDEPSSLPPSPYQNWTAYYGADAPAQAFKDYDLVVFDSDHHPPIMEVKKYGTKVLAYVSVAEIDPYRPYTERFLSMPGIRLGSNEQWQSHIVDIRSREWQNFLINEWLPRILEQDFDGIFLDTIDTALHVQKQDDKYYGMDQATVDLISNMRRMMPHNKLIMVNRGFDILPYVGKDIDIVLAESILVDTSRAGRPFFPTRIYREYSNKLQRLRQKYSHLSIFTLDYPETIDKTSWLQVCKRHRKQGFVPQISTMDLKQIRPPFLRCEY